MTVQLIARNQITTSGTKRHFQLRRADHRFAGFDEIEPVIVVADQAAPPILSVCLLIRTIQVHAGT
jgi:hypothetical protein